MRRREAGGWRPNRAQRPAYEERGSRRRARQSKVMARMRAGVPAKGASGLAAATTTEDGRELRARQLQHGNHSLESTPSPQARTSG
mmetsp:Transcript_62354/g.167298  ORF Transcript_62354/g.167298 Transcript_62354/m.167298 type:complete len:86 (-) Transcript_62354:71-328(-)